MHHALAGVDLQIEDTQDAYGQLSAADFRASEPQRDSLYRQAAGELYGRVWAPLEDALAGTEEVYLAPDGELSRMAFEALVDTEGEYLIHRYQFAYLSSGRDLLSESPEPGSGTVVFAGPDYDLGAGARAEQAEAMGLQRGLRGADRGGLERNWPALPGAAAEVSGVRTALDGSPVYGPVAVYDSAQALEEAFKGLPTVPRVLHVATHGFFQETRELTVEERARCERAWQDTDIERGKERGLLRLRCAENPLLRSGLVLAGANAVGTDEAGLAVEDGWLTAEEIVMLDLNGTDLVVLSACETGLGDIQVGEGVYGLRRAFQLAGAQSVLMSLHLVPDEETRPLMARFYGGLDQELTPRQAWRTAQLQTIDVRTDDAGAAHPFFWSSFILQGTGN